MIRIDLKNWNEEELMENIQNEIKTVSFWEMPLFVCGNKKEQSNEFDTRNLRSEVEIFKQPAL